MYMAMIGMAIVAVPRGVFRALVWLVMGAAGWLMTAVEWAYATVSSEFMSGVLTVESDNNSDSISVYANNDCVFVSDLFNTPSMVTTDASAVRLINVVGNGGADYIDLSAVSSANGFDHADLADFGAEIFGDGGNDSIYGSQFPDTIYGNDGADYLNGGGGADTLHHNSGSSSPDGSADTLVGGIGTDHGYWNAGDGDTEDTENDN